MYVDLGGMRGGFGQKYREVELKYVLFLLGRERHCWGMCGEIRVDSRNLHCQTSSSITVRMRNELASYNERLAGKACYPTCRRQESRPHST